MAHVTGCLCRFCLVMGLLGLPFPALQASPALPPHVEGELLVRYGPGMLTGVRAALPHGTTVEPVTPDTVRVILPAGEDLAQMQDRLARDPRVRHVQPNYIKRIQLLPNDHNFVLQWGMHNLGWPVPLPNGPDVAGTAGADIDAVSAWDVTTGSGEIVVALIDTGVQLDHRELAVNLWNNPNEAPNGVDDDNNGYVDDIRGWDWVGNDSLPIDNEGHGTGLAGIIAARGNNGFQIAGLNWQVSLMVLRTFDSQGVSDTRSIVKAIRYAVDHGARIINASYGAVGGTAPGTPGFDEAEYEAYRYAAERGVLVVAAACNNGAVNDGPRACVPASYDLPNIVSVAASDMNDRIADFSNRGAESVDLAAPGVGIVTVAWRNRSLGAYTVVDGTSIASAFVTGAAALLQARARELGLTLSAERLRAILVDSTDILPGLSGVVASSGRLNIARALAALEDFARTQGTDGEGAQNGAGGGGGNGGSSGGGGAALWVLVLAGVWCWGAMIPASSTTVPWRGWWPSARVLTSCIPSGRWPPVRWQARSSSGSSS